MNCPHCQIAYDPKHWGNCPHCGDADEPTTERELSGVLQTSTILIAAGDEASGFYRSMDEVPEPLRQMLVQSTNGLNSGTIYIADQRGREQIDRALRKLPNVATAPVLTRFSAGVAPHQQVGTPARRSSLSALWFGFMVVAFAGAVVWLAGSRNW